jgi:formylglycine-generating enzyme required for sulfatase activity
LVKEEGGPSGKIFEINSTFSWRGFSCNSQIEKYEYMKDADLWIDNGLNKCYTWSGYSEGEHTFEVRALDSKGDYSNIIKWVFIYSQEMVRVEGGTFIMGDEFGDLPFFCRPVHEVTLMYDFYVGKYEVTFDEYDAFCEDTGTSKPYDEGWGRGTRPVINVSWWDAIAYCNWLSEKEGLPVAYRLKGEANEGQLLDSNGFVTTDITKVLGYRLLTEAEWEYAARGGKHHSSYKYSGSDDVDEVAWYYFNSYNNELRRKTTWPVGFKLPNALGIYDMSGNVWEWCSDWYEANYYEKSATINPYNFKVGFDKVIRQGSLYNKPLDLRIASRNSNNPDEKKKSIGFRVCRISL